MNHTFIFLLVSVLFVDYGNKEVLPLSSLLPLPVHLAVLPTQALICSFKGDSSFFQKALPQNISLALIQWLEHVLIGKVLKAQISSFTISGDAHISAQLYVPTKLVVNDKSLSFLNHVKLTFPPQWISSESIDGICLESLIEGMLSYNMTGQTTPSYNMTGQTTPSYNMTGQTTPSYNMTGQTTPSYNMTGQTTPSYNMTGQTTTTSKNTTASHQPLTTAAIHNILQSQQHPRPLSILLLPIIKFLIFN